MCLSLIWRSIEYGSLCLFVGRVRHTDGIGAIISTMKVKELIALIETDGWLQVRQKGSHRQFHHPTKPGTVTVSGKLNVEVPSGTLNNALKQAGLK